MTDNLRTESIELRERVYSLSNHFDSIRNGLPEEWQDFAVEVSNELRHIVVEMTASPATCQTCNGHGMVDASSGQTPDSYAPDAMACPDFGPLIFEIDALLAAQARLQFAKEGYDAAAAERYGIELLDFMRRRGVELRKAVAAHTEKSA